MTASEPKFFKAFCKERWVGILVALTVLLGAVMRFLCIGWNTLERDEAQVLGLVNQSDFHNVVNAVVCDGNPPLIHLISFPLVHLFGLNILPEKILSWLIATSVPLFAYNLLKRPFGRTVSFICCVLIALSPTLMRFGELFRGYGLMQICALWATVLLFEFFEKDRRPPLIKYALALALGMYLHLSFCALIIAHILFVAIQTLTKVAQYKVAINWFKSAAIGGLIFLPWAIVVLWQRANVQVWTEKLSLMNAFKALLGWLFEMLTPISMYQSLLNCLFCAGVFFLLRKQILKWNLLLFLCTLLGFAILFVVGFPFRDRYISVATISGLLTLSVATQNLLNFQASGKSKAWLAFAAFSPILLLFVAWFSNLVFMFVFPESAFADVARAFKPQINASQDLVVVSFEQACPEVLRILPTDIQVVGYPDLARVTYINWLGYNKRLTGPHSLESLYTQMENCLSAGGKIWLVSVPIKDKEQLAVSEQSLWGWQIEQKRSMQIQDWLAAHASQQQKVSFMAREGAALGLQFGRH